MMLAWLTAFSVLHTAAGAFAEETLVASEIFSGDGFGWTFNFSVPEPGARVNNVKGGNSSEALQNCRNADMNDPPPASWFCSWWQPEEGCTATCTGGGTGGTATLTFTVPISRVNNVPGVNSGFRVQFEYSSRADVNSNDYSSYRVYCGDAADAPLRTGPLGLRNANFNEEDTGGEIEEGCEADISLELNFYLDDPSDAAGVTSVQLWKEVVTPSPTSPTSAPSSSPSTQPTAPPTSAPSAAPSGSPTSAPSTAPSSSPSAAPSGSPSQRPTSSPTESPSASPTAAPSSAPTSSPSSSPSAAPSAAPSSSPTSAPSAAPSTAPTPTPYNPPNLTDSSEVVIEGLGLEAFPQSLERSFLIQFVIFTLLYALLIARIAREFAAERCAPICKRAGKATANRHSIMLSVLAGCCVRLCYVDLVDIVPETPREVEFVLRAAKETLWFASFAFMVHYWVEVQTQMRKVTNVDTQRGKMLGSICAFTLLNVVQVIAECLRLNSLVLVAKVLGAIFLVAWIVYAVTWFARLWQRMSHGSRSHRSSGGGGKEGKATRSTQRLTWFVAIEVVLLWVLMLEWAFTLWAQEEARISLRGDATLVFALKILARSTEWLMLATLVSVCCVRRPKREGGGKGKGGGGESHLSTSTSTRWLMMRTFRRLGTGDHSSRGENGQQSPSTAASRNELKSEAVTTAIGTSNNSLLPARPLV